jgi:hypothetical protein
LLHTQLPVHSVATFGKHAAKSPSAVAVSTLTGWQNSLVKSGVSPDGVDGVVGLVGSTVPGLVGSTVIGVVVHSHCPFIW